VRPTQAKLFETVVPGSALRRTEMTGDDVAAVLWKIFLTREEQP
jgi:hypothetical protein